MEHTTDDAPVFECEKYAEAYVEVAKIASLIDQHSASWTPMVAQKNANKLRDLLRDLLDNEAKILKGGTS
jgi:hypothetical protein